MPIIITIRIFSLMVNSYSLHYTFVSLIVVSKYQYLILLLPTVTKYFPSSLKEIPLTYTSKSVINTSETILLYMLALFIGN